jgi:hypothetical protein
MAETPTSYKDPYWTQLASATEQKLDLPPGLLVGVLTRGERSNADQVSDAGAKTPFQIIPATRKAAIDKYGIDPYLSPENAAEVAGNLLKDSLARNKGDVPAAVGEYIGGTDRSNWGPTTRAYVKRVTGAMPLDAAPAAVPATVPDAATPAAADGPSTFDKLWGAANAPPAGQVANILKAYQSGQMAPDEAKQFESDVHAGKVMLPQGASLQAGPPAAPPAAAAAGGFALPQGVVDAFDAGKISGKDRDQLLADVKSGKAAAPDGSLLQLQALYPNRDYRSAQIPGTTVQRDEQGRPYVDTTPNAPTTLGEKIVGAGEAGLSAATGMVGYPVAIGSAIKDLGAAAINKLQGGAPVPDNVDANATAAGAAVTYAPRTPTGQEYAQNLGDAMQPLAGLAPAEAAALHSGVAPVVGAVRQVARAAPGAAIEAVQNVGQAVKAGAGAVADATGALVDRVRGVAPAPAAEATPGTMASGGAAGTDIATQRVALGQQMDAPIELTKGQATRDFEQQRFEKETMKDPTAAGEMLRQRAADQNGAVQRNFDVWVDQTGAEAPDLRGAGVKVVEALRKDAAKDKAEIRAAYQAADAAGETAAPVSLQKVVQYLNDNAPEAVTAPILKFARAKAIQLGIAREEGGVLVANDPAAPVAKPSTRTYGALYDDSAAAPAGNPPGGGVTLKRAELFRKAINQATDYEPTNIRQSSILKGAIDADTEGAGGPLYQQARRLYENSANRYQNNAVIAKLMNNKRGTNDRQVAFEDVWKHTIASGSLDDVRKVRSVLQTGGPEGQQAWREIQGRTIAHLKEAATQNTQMDTRGQPVVSPAGLHKAVRSLDQDGKLDFIFGKQGAQKLRDIDELSQVMFTAPSGAVNASNTGSVILAALTEAGVTGAITGLPLPVLSIARAAKNFRDQAVLRNRVLDALSGSRIAAPVRTNP